MIKSFKLFIVSILTSVAVFAADTESSLNASIDAGYNNHYIVNGLAKTSGAGYAGFDIGKSYFGVDGYVGGVVLPDSNGIDESHWKIGLGKSFKITEKFSLRGDLQGLRHQTSIIGGVNSIEVAPKIALVNPYATPYIRGSHDFNLKQSGYIVGVERATDVFGWFTLTPTLEYGKFTDYDVVVAKVGISRTFFNHMQPYAEVGWYDNNKFSTSKYNYASQQFNSDIVAVAGVRWSF
jgi:hypothetical protein